LLSGRYSQIDVILHGGEPLIVPLSLYEILFDTLAPFNVEYHIQTNLYELSLNNYSRLFEIIKGLSFTLDGPKQLHDNQRINREHSGTYENILSNLNELTKTFPNLTIGLLCTLSQNSLYYKDDFYPFFKEIGIQRVGFNPVFNRTNSISNSAYYDILNSIFMHWTQDINPLDISLFVDALKHITQIENSSSLCYGFECYKNIISISTLGNITPCLHWQADDTFTVLNIKSLNDYYEYYCKNFFSYKSDKCLSCEYLTFCGGGCPHEYVSGNWYFCDATKRFLDMVNGFVKDQIS